ncbi:MAG: hypothetical protein ACRDRT_17525, partial [Pseudonocardiaceae bacterium]
MAGVTLDTGALIAIERGSPRMQALLDEAWASASTIVVPAGVVAQAWRGQAKQARLALFLRQAVTEIAVLDEASARAVGVLCGRAGTSDIVDASVVLCARQRAH